jgi:YidC/Oxa1 family membrane protein insertase
MMDMDKKSLIGIAACIAFYLGYSQYLQKKYPNYGTQTEKTENAAVDPQKPTPTQTSAAAGSQTPASSTNEAPAAPKPAALSDQNLTYTTDTSIYKFDQQTGGLSSIKLKNYWQAINSEEMVELAPSPLRIFGTTSKEILETPSEFFGERNDRELTFWRIEGPWKISQSYTIPETGYQLALRISFENTGTAAANLVAGIAMQQPIALPASGGFFQSQGSSASIPPAILVGTSEKTHRFAMTDFCKDGKGDSDAAGTATKLPFLGIDQHYFLKVLTPEFDQVSFAAKPVLPVSAESCTVQLNAFQPYGSVAPGQKVEFKFHSYFGPKQADLLTTYDENLENTIDLGMFAALARPLLTGLKLVNNYTHNFGFAILIVTLALKICFFPLTRQAAISANKMKKLQPEMNAIRERHKNDQQTQQRELMAFMVKNKVNPMKGCLPILPQIPVFFAYYQVLQHAIELRHAPFAGWIHDLSAMDPYYVTPLLLGVGMVVQQKLTPMTGMDKSQEKILMFMPVVFTLLMLTLPAGMVIYMLTNTVVSILQQQWLNQTLKA